MAQFKLTIVSPRDKVFDQNADSFVAPGEEGDFGVLAHHAPMVALVRRGIAQATIDGKSHFFITGSGFVEVSREEVCMLVDYAAKAGSLEAAKGMLAEHLKEVNSGGVKIA